MHDLEPETRAALAHLLALTSDALGTRSTTLGLLRPDGQLNVVVSHPDDVASVGDLRACLDRAAGSGSCIEHHSPAAGVQYLAQALATGTGVLVVAGDDGRPFTPHDHEQLRRFTSVIEHVLDAANETAGARQRAEQVFDRMPLMVWMATADGTLDYANEAFYRYVGTRDVDLAGGGWLEHVHPDDRAGVQAAIQGAVTAEAGPVLPTGPSQIRLRRARDGEYRWHLLTRAPIRDRDGSLLRWVGSAADLHEHTLAMERLREREEALRTIVDHEPECVKLVSADGTLVNMNPAGLQMIEVDHLDEVRGQRVTDLVHPDDRAAFTALHRQVADDRVSGTLRFRLVGRRGTLRWVESTSAPLEVPDESRANVLSVTRDVTEHQHSDTIRAAEASLLRSITSGGGLESVLAEAMRALNQSAASLDPVTSAIFLVNRTEHRFRVISAPGVDPGLITAIERRAAGDPSTNIGLAVTHRSTAITDDTRSDPRWRDCQDLAETHGIGSCWATPVIDPDGEVEAVIVQYRRQHGPPTTYDVQLAESMARLLSVALHRLRMDEELRRSEERFRMVSRVVSDVVWDLDLVAGTAWRSEGMAELLGFDREQIGSSMSQWSMLVHPDDVVRVQQSIDEALTSGADQWSGEYRVQRADGSWASILERAQVLRDDRGGALRLVGSTVDVTEQRAREAQLEQTHRLEAVGQLTGGIAHDFNNLLTVILGNAELLVEHLEHRDDLRPLAAMTKVAAERGAELTQRLLAFARRQPLDPTRVHIARLLADLGPLLQRTLGEETELVVEIAPTTWPALVDAAQLESAILNLCINARDAMPGGGRLTITTSNLTVSGAQDAGTEVVAPGDYVSIGVADIGVGMDPDVLARAFEPFFTTKGVGKGTGLGLSMVYGFAKQSNGHVRITSTPGRGTTVTLLVPRAGDDRTGGLPRPRLDEIPRGDERVLLVEDDDLVRTHVAASLQMLGYDVVQAANGPAALKVVRDGSLFDLLLTDIVMPGGMNGRQLADEVRAIHPQLPVLFTSGYSENALVHDGRLEAGVHLLGKPYQLEDLANAVRDALGTCPPR